MRNRKKLLILISTILITYTTRVHAETFAFCQETPVLRIFQILGIIMTIVKILIPVVLIVLISIDLFKAFLNADDKAITSAKETGIRRIIAAIIIFFVPTIVSVILTNISGYNKENYESIEAGTWKDCTMCYVKPNDKTCNTLITTAQKRDKAAEKAALAEEEKKQAEMQKKLDGQIQALFAKARAQYQKTGVNPIDEKSITLAGDWDWPFKEKWPITSGFGPRDFDGFHYGIDIGAPENTEILAVDDGMVHFVRREPTYDTGNYTVIYHGKDKNGNDVYSEYMHQNLIYVEQGEPVKKGQVIGTVGSTGQSTGAHLHLSKGIGDTYWLNRVNPFG